MISAASHPCRSDLHLLAPLCGQLVAALRDLTPRLIAHHEQAQPGHAYLIRQAIAEAERLAWETSVPHLVLPGFAEVQVERALAAARRPLPQAA